MSLYIIYNYVQIIAVYYGTSLKEAIAGNPTHLVGGQSFRFQMCCLDPQIALRDGFITILVTLWLFNIAMGNGPFIDGLPIKNGDFPWLC